MSSLQTSWKQIDTRAGYYVPVGNCVSKFYANNGTDAVPNFGQMVSTMSTSGAAVSTLIASAGAGVFRDHGKTLVSSGRVFRKVQLLISSNSVLNNGTDGVGGVSVVSGVGAASTYLTGFIELPGQSTGSGVGNLFTPVARLG
jgi:hypothetical protein